MWRVRRVRVVFRFPYIVIIYPEKVTFSCEKVTFAILKMTFSDGEVSLLPEKMTFSFEFSREFNRKDDL